MRIGGIEFLQALAAVDFLQADLGELPKSLIWALLNFSMEFESYATSEQIAKLVSDQIHELSGCASSRWDDLESQDQHLRTQAINILKLRRKSALGDWQLKDTLISERLADE